MSVVIKSCNILLVGLFVFTISACSSTSEIDEDYKGVYNTKKSSRGSLEVPPDLAAPDSSNALSIPSLSGTGANFSEYSNLGEGSANNVLPKSSAGIRFVREGRSFWLEIESKPDEIWRQTRSFFMDLGFSFVRENPVNGLIETEWLENRLDVPTGWFSSLLGGLFSTGLMDKYRIRIERSDKDNVSLLFITHQGLKEVSYGNFSETDYSIKWQPRESDPELEAEMLQRFLVFRGVAKAHAKQLTSQKKDIEIAKLVKDQSGVNSVIEVSEIFPRTWRRISIALDRMGIVVEDRNRSKGLYYIKTTEDFIKGDAEDKSWLESIFGSNEKQLKIAQYQLSVDDLENKTLISILSSSGEQDNSKTGYFILKKLQSQLR